SFYIVICLLAAPTLLYTLSLHDALPICRGLLADRAPGDGPPLGRRGHGPGVRRREGLPRRHGGQGVRAPRGPGRRRHAKPGEAEDRKSTRLNSSHLVISYAVFCLKKKRV